MIREASAKIEALWDSPRAVKNFGRALILFACINTANVLVTLGEANQTEADIDTIEANYPYSEGTGSIVASMEERVDDLDSDIKEDAINVASYLGVLYFVKRRQHALSAVPVTDTPS